MRRHVKIPLTWLTEAVEVFHCAAYVLYFLVCRIKEVPPGPFLRGFWEWDAGHPAPDVYSCTRNCAWRVPRAQVCPQRVVCHGPRRLCELLCAVEEAHVAQDVFVRMLDLHHEAQRPQHLYLVVEKLLFELPVLGLVCVQRRRCGRTQQGVEGAHNVPRLDYVLLELARDEDARRCNDLWLKLLH